MTGRAGEDRCFVREYSSAVCSRGTHSCEEEHKPGEVRAERLAEAAQEVLDADRAYAVRSNRANLEIVAVAFQALSEALAEFRAGGGTT